MYSKEKVKTTNISALIHVYGYMMLPVFILSAVVMGWYWRYAFTVIVLFFTPFILLTFIFVALYNTMYFDDENKKIVKGNNWWSVPYDKIKEIQIVNFGSFFSIIINKQWNKKIVLAAIIDKKYKKEIIDKLKEKIPEGNILESKIHVRMGLAVLTVVILLFYIVNIINIYSNNHSARVFLKTWKIEKNYDNINSYKSNGLSFDLPKEYIKDFEKESFFRSSNDGSTITQFKEMYNMNIRKYYFLHRVMNMNDSYDLFNAVYSAKFNLYMLYFKIRMIRSYENMEIWRFEKDNMKGFIMRGKNNQKYIATVMVYDKKNNKEIDFIVNSKSIVSIKLLNTIIGGLKEDEDNKGK